MKKTRIIIFVILLIVLIGGLFYFDKLNNFDDEVTSSSNIDYKNDNEIDWSIYDVEYISLNNESITITKGGIYELSGTLNGGNITVNTSDNVKIILNNATIKSTDGPAISILSAKNAYIELKNGSDNYIEDSSKYSDKSLEGTIYSTTDLFFIGDGKLTIDANYHDGIVSKDDLNFESGTYVINSVDEGIRGKDSIVILDGNYTITSGGDSLKSTNDTDSEKGYIVVENGEFNITSDSDAIFAVTEVYIYNGSFNIKTGGGSDNDSNGSDWGNWNNSTTEEASAKAIKASTKITIEKGDFDINSSDDAIHSNNNLWIKDGTFNISSGDDGIHADDTVLIDNGKISITNSYEGIEGSNISINGGDISIVSSDDGINVGGGNDSSATSRPGANTYESSSSMITISDGNIYINSTGDGLDANGSITMSGGIVVVNGPTNNGNGSLDYDSTFVVTGGTLMASGSSGMAQMPSSNSSVYSIMINFTSSISSGTLISIKDDDGNEIFTYEASKNYQNLVITSSTLKKGTYSIFTNGSSSKSNNNGIYEVGGYKEGSSYSSFTIDSINTTIGTSIGQRGR